MVKLDKDEFNEMIFTRINNLISDYELIKDGENGLLVPVHDVNAIADHICRLLEDDAIGERMGEAARSILKSNAVNKIGAEFYDYVANIK